MCKKLTHEQQKGNLLKEFDGFAKLAEIDPELCVDVFRGRFGRLNGGDFNAAEVEAHTAFNTVKMMANGEFGFGHAAKSAKVYYQLEDGTVEDLDS